MQKYQEVRALRKLFFYNIDITTSAVQGYCFISPMGTFAYPAAISSAKEGVAVKQYRPLN